MAEPLGRPYPVRFSEAERQELEAEALRQYGAGRKGGQLVRRYVREGLARDKGEAAAPSVEAHKALVNEIKTLRLELARIGGNLNQIAHAVNIHETVNGESLAVRHDELRDMFQKTAAAVREVGNGLLHR